MKCNEFISLIPDFVEDSLEESNYEGFVKHAGECSECMDELEIHYMIRVGLERIEDDETKSFDIQGELHHQLQRYEKRADKLFERKVYRTVTFIVAEICAVLCIIHALNLYF